MKIWLGSLAALLSALAFALNVTLAKLVYEAGGNIHAINLIRPFAFLALLLPWLLLSRADLKLPRRKLGLTVILGAILTAELYALLAAIHFIPVALAVLLTYVYPLLIALFETVTGRGRLGPVRAFAILVGFAGLAVTLLGTDDLAATWEGIALALLSAVVLGSLLLVSEPAMAGSDRRVVMVHMLVVVALVMTAITASGLVAPVWPATTAGWWAFAGSTLCFVMATFLLFVAVDLVGPLATAAIDNSSPIWAIAFGLLLLGESLTGQQLVGAAVVLGAILIFQLRQGRKGAEATPPSIT